ncbi:MAG: hypothetical protein HOY79_39570 [Streptomyces sp.]|nr:hypothetical protein [Streptomyces sp.]
MQEIEFRSRHICVDTDPALCVPCQERLDRQLALLPRVYGELEVALVPAPDSGDRLTGTARPGIPLNGPAVEARADIRGTLASWADLMVEGRNVRLPLRTVPALAAFLRRHLGWLAVHPAAEDAATEIDELLRRSLAIARPRHDRHIPVGPCLVAACRGRLTAVARDPGTALPSAVECDTDPAHTWPPERWRSLHRKLPTLPQGLSAKQISHAWRIPAGSVSSLAEEHQWRRREDGRHVYYAQDDVLDTLGRDRLEPRA